MQTAKAEVIRRISLTPPALPQLGADRGEFRKRLFLLPVADGDCLPDALLPVTPDDSSPEGPLEDRDTARYVLEVMGFDDEAYERKKQEPHARLRRIGHVIRLKGKRFESPHDGLER